MSGDNATKSAETLSLLKTLEETQRLLVQERERFEAEMRRARWIMLHTLALLKVDATRAKATMKLTAEQHAEMMRRLKLAIPIAAEEKARGVVSSKAISFVARYKASLLGAEEVK